MLFNYENHAYYKKATFYTEKNDVDAQVNIYLDKYSGVVEVEVAYCGRDRGDVWTHPEIYEVSNAPFFIVVQKWINAYKEEGDTVAPNRIGKKESW